MRKKQRPLVEGTVEKTVDENSTAFFALFGRLKEATGVRTDYELGNALDLKHSTISAAKSKSEIPPGWIVDISKKFDVSLDWLLYGIGQKNLNKSVDNHEETRQFTDLSMSSVDVGAQYLRDMRQDITELRGENRELRHENQILRQENREMHDINRSYFKEIWELKAENQRLQREIDDINHDFTDKSA